VISYFCKLKATGIPVIKTCSSGNYWNSGKIEKNYASETCL
jgi:hypothetical protein